MLYQATSWNKAIFFTGQNKKSQFILFSIVIILIPFQEWETETLVLEVGGDDELGVELAGGRDDPVCPGENPIYVSSINKVGTRLNKIQETQDIAINVRLLELPVNLYLQVNFSLYYL